MDPKISIDEQDDTNSLREHVLEQAAYDIAVEDGFKGSFEEWRRMRAATTLPAPPDKGDDEGDDIPF